MKFVTCLQILLFFKKDLLFIFAGRVGGWHKIGHFCGRRKCTTPKWFKISADSIVRDRSFFFISLSWIHEPDNFDCVENNPQPFPHSHISPCYSTDDQNKASVTLSWHLNFYVKKFCSLLNIASWLASNKLLWTRMCNRCR